MYFTHPQFKSFNLRPFLKRFSEIDLKNKLIKIFPDSHIVFTDSGRSAFQIIIKELGLENSAMLVPAYICDIFQPIFKKYNIKPIYLDIDLKTFQTRISEIEEKIKPEIKSILICHTYGLRADLDKILEITKKYGLKIIEDCAHTCPPLTDSPNKARGDFLFFSFSKICPNINGGMLISQSSIRTKFIDYNFVLSDIIKFLRLFPFLAKFSEKFRKEKPQTIEEFKKPKTASKISLRLFNNYLENLEKESRKRIELAKYFQEKLSGIGFEIQSSDNNSFTYLSALVPKNINRDELVNKLRSCKIFCSRIWQKPLFAELPNTRETAKRVINFPLQHWFTQEDIDKIIKAIKLIFSETKKYSSG